MTSSGDRHHGGSASSRQASREDHMLEAWHPIWRKRPSEDVLKSVSPIVAYGGAIIKSSPSGARSRKVVQLEEIKIVII